jgi:predicted SAM-dependent methyltransferase
VRLNLGCGADIRPGYVNVDFRKLPGVDLVVDLSVFPWPFMDGAAEEVLLLDFLEHFPYAQTKRILLECHKVLSDEGRVVIQAPDARILGTVLSGKGRYQCNRCGEWMHGIATEEWTERCPRCGQSEDEVFDAAMMRMYGGQDHLGNFHQTCFTSDSLARLGRSCGLFWQEDLEKDHQRANWNFKSVFTRGDVW